MDEIIYGIFKVQYDFALEVWFSILYLYCITPCEDDVQVRVSAVLEGELQE